MKKVFFHLAIIIFTVIALILTIGKSPVFANKPPAPKTPITDILKKNYSAEVLKVGGVEYLAIKPNHHHFPGAAYAYLEYMLYKYAVPANERKILEVFGNNPKYMTEGLEFWFPYSRESAERPYLWKVTSLAKNNLGMVGNLVDLKYNCHPKTRFLFVLR